MRVNFFAALFTDFLPTQPHAFLLKSLAHGLFLHGLIPEERAQ
jgi:hypothetical protein